METATRALIEVAISVGKATVSYDYYTFDGVRHSDLIICSTSNRETSERAFLELTGMSREDVKFFWPTA